MVSRVVEERSLRPVAENALATLRMFHERGDSNARHNVPGEPMLDVIAGFLFLGWSRLSLATRWRRHPC